jgi:hypothetical protein
MSPQNADTAEAVIMPIIALVLGLIFVLRTLGRLRRAKRAEPRSKAPASGPAGASAPRGTWPTRRDWAGRTPPDAAGQLRIVMDAEFTIQPLLNSGEARVFAELRRAVHACNPSWHVMAQVSLGEVLRSKDQEAFRCVNSKRVDLLLMDGSYRPRHAIEYQGGAHYQGAAAARDAVKKEALRRAGVGYHEVVAGFTTPAELRRLVEKLVDRPDASTGGLIAFSPVPSNPCSTAAFVPAGAPR